MIQPVESAFKCFSSSGILHNFCNFRGENDSYCVIVAGSPSSALSRLAARFRGSAARARDPPKEPARLLINLEDKVPFPKIIWNLKFQLKNLNTSTCVVLQNCISLSRSLKRYEKKKPFLSYCSKFPRHLSFVRCYFTGS